MLAKLTRGNQLTIPKRIIEQAHLAAGRDYLDVTYLNGAILLKPIDVEDRVPPEAYEALLKEAFQVQPGDIVADAAKAAAVLQKRMKRRRS